MYRSYTGGEAPPITTIQNTQAPPEFLTLPQFIPTLIPISIPNVSDFFDVVLPFASENKWPVADCTLQDQKRSEGLSKLLWGFSCPGGR